MTMAKYALQRGLSLVEVMIGITIALILTLGLMVVIMGTSRGFQTQDDFARLQESGMTALSYIGDSIRHAGFYGIGTAVTVVDAATAAVATTTDCGSAANPPAANWAINTAAPMVGFDGLTAATVNAMLPCVLASN
ncbi:MAG: prepilin-type N-terminal cleavage/methylation domain-containing protein, partial [Proteobacteria bacterium]|nr:prepilin-type N-terminal cleavage/methylation domain-containing protein [Pseudomonadota bacterium]